MSKDFIEAHHMVPISLLKGKVMQLNSKMGFAVLCSNYHQMIHRTENPE